MGWLEAIIEYVGEVPEENKVFALKKDAHPSMHLPEFIEENEFQHPIPKQKIEYGMGG